ncbi:MAG TPA: type VI secretion system protein TssA [Candidatus Dormibacteraeota bacterium]|nr:type VI secretion system protein TssA [Candidatus Dormibacteraeota bacterium]
MPFPDDLLNPIEGPNPSGANLRYDPVYDKIKEARREEAQPPPGMTEQDRKVSDNVQVIKLTTDLLTNKTKDLQLAAWLTEALLKQKGFGGLKDGLALCCSLVDKFWDNVYPEIEDGDAESRGAPLGFVGTKLEIPLKLVPVVEKVKYALLDYQQSREVGYEDQAKSDDTKKRRAALVKEGKLTPEAFDKAFEETPKKFYAQAEKDLDACLENLTRLKKSCDEKFGDEGPAFGPLQSSLEAERHLIHQFLQKKREKEPDPVEVVPAAEAAAGAEGEGGVAAAGPVRTGVLISVEGSSEPADRIDAIRKVAEAAAFLRRREPQSPASYLMLRGLRWGELRAAIELADPTKLEAPPTELRRHLKKLLIDKKYEELLEAAESAMALPCARAWLDLQRFVVEACEALGSGYEAIARAIRSELKALVTDIPQLLDATLMDETAAANAETRAWLVALSQAPAATAPATDGAPAAAASNGLGSRWPGQPTDAYATALQALREGQERKAFEILQQDIARKRSGRERFRRRMQLVEICATTNKPNVAQPILDDLAAAIENHKLDEWEDPGLVASALATLMKMSVKIQADKAAQQKIFERICRLDPAQALGDAK